MISIRLDDVLTVDRAYTAKEQAFVDSFYKWTDINFEHKDNYQVYKLHHLPNGGKIMLPLIHLDNFMPLLDEDNIITRMRSNHEVAFILCMIFSYNENDLENFYLTLAYFEGLPSDIQSLLRLDVLLKKLYE
ncbi:hypothetical protein [Commensalibacter nepenthis]|uniref:Uncharacterized protein n=1 Tax=Commensalibacter nepenthis TaxID=3043872 RepID=A0ABT6Q4A5_9PROT|nr:hypothetical protein [Commensalibacter sp. TBRC 10068]MDI2111726.1 hypothetical protein [Commensalibacter sp. TBRC 10068]